MPRAARLQAFDSDAARKTGSDSFVGAVLTGISRVVGSRYSRRIPRDLSPFSFVRPVRTLRAFVLFAYVQGGTPRARARNDYLSRLI